MNLRLLIVRRRYLGDLVLLDPIVQGLRVTYPSAFISILVDEGYGDVLKGHPAIDRIIEIPMKRKGEGWFSFLSRYFSIGQELRNLKLDTALLYQPRFRISGLLALAKIPRRIGFRRHDHSFLAKPTVLIDTPDAFFANSHVVDIYRELLAPLGEVARAPFALPINGEALTKVDALLASTLLSQKREKPLLLIHPGGRVACRRWPAAAFAEVISTVKAEGKIEVILTSGPGEESLVEEIARLLPIPNRVAVIPPLSLPQFTALCHRAALYLGNDTGSMHVAAGAGTKVVGLFGSQLIPVFRPYGEGHIPLQSPMPCPCPTPGECDPTNSYKNRCVSLIPVPTVIAALRSLLNVSPESPPNSPR